jgi:hypothetical protein
VIIFCSIFKQKKNYLSFKIGKIKLERAKVIVIGMGMGGYELPRFLPNKDVNFRYLNRNIYPSAARIVKA